MRNAEKDFSTKEVKTTQSPVHCVRRAAKLAVAKKPALRVPWGIFWWVQSASNNVVTHVQSAMPKALKSAKSASKGTN